MGVTKTDHFTDSQNTIATLAKALGHPARIAILEYLMKANKCICSDIVNELPLAQATVSQHLRELKNAGLIKGNIEGTAINYCIDQDVLALIPQYFSSMLHQLSEKYGSCC